MKKFTKLFLSCAAMAAVTAAVATSAMAAKLDKVEYVAGDTADSVKITLPAEFTDTTKTLLILEKGVTLEQAAANPSTATILQIGQDAYTGENGVVTVPIAKKDATADADKGTYAVYMGGDQGVVYEGSFRLGGSDRLLGDANGNGKVQVTDALAVANHVAGNKILTDEDLIAGDANDNGKVQVTDALAIANFLAGNKANVPEYVAFGTTTISDKQNDVK